MIELQYEWDLGPFEGSMAAVAKRLGNLQPVLEGPVTTLLQQMNRRNFGDEGLQSTPKWPPLTPDVAARPRIAMMRVTDELFRSITSRNANSIIEAGRQKLSFGTRVPWSIFHQYGTRNMPQRQPIPDPIPASDEALIRHSLQMWVIFGRFAIKAAR